MEEEKSKTEEMKEISESQLIEERKKKLKEFFKKSDVWVYVLLVLAVILGLYIRSLPMTDHGGRPGLWDVASNSWTLGPDLDPFLFTRYAEIIVNEGKLSGIDYMRNYPVGFPLEIETRLLPYMIAYTYYSINLFSEATIEYAAAIFPVIMFALTTIAFFFFSRELFLDDRKKANIIAIISTFFMIVIPDFLSRTVAGVPEKESAAFFFMFLSFYLFLKAWKAKKLRNAIFISLLSGISTAAMGLIWGGVSYIFITVATASLVAFVIGKIQEKETLIYSVWIIVSLFLIRFFTEKYSIKGLLTSFDTGLAFAVFLILIVHLVIFKTKIHKIQYIERLRKKFPDNLLSFVFSVFLIILLVIVFFGFSVVLEKIDALNHLLIKPVTGRWSMTVAENRQPYFREWAGSFGPNFKNIPILFWLFFIGSVVLFKETLKRLNKKDSLALTLCYTLFLFGLIFSRYAPHPHVLDGEGFVSKLFYFGSAFLLVASVLYYYIRYYKENNDSSFKEIDYSIIFLLILFFLTLFTARSAVRLIMVLVPIAPIFVGYLIVICADKFKNTKDETLKVILGIFLILFLLLSIYSFYVFYSSIKAQSYNFVPSSYTFQWQKAMKWVRENTDKNAVFAHWWDYGYWVQSIGKRATVTDGGNAIVYWNYLTGRFVLTGDNQKDALEFLYSHNTSYLLIDSSDLGKYGAFSSIGSDINYDRASSGPPAMLSDSKQTQETRDGMQRIYQGASGIEEDIIYKEDSLEINLFSGRAAIIGIILDINNNGSFKQPTAVFYNQITGGRINIPLRYLYYNNSFVDFEKGLNATIYIIPRIDQTSQGLQIDKMGAAIYISPRIMRGLLAQIYLLNDPLKKFQAFNLAYSEENLIIDSLNSQGAGLNEFIAFNGQIMGPIKIWEIRYTGDEKINPAYLETSPPPNIITWQL